MAHVVKYCNFNYFGGCGVLQFINLTLADGYYFYCVGGGFGGKGTPSARLAVSASVAAFKSVLRDPSHLHSLLIKFDLSGAFSALMLMVERQKRHLGPYAKHCRSCYFQTKIDLRRRSIYVGMQNAILTLVGRLRSN